MALMAARSNKATQARPVFRLVPLLHHHSTLSLGFNGFAHRFETSHHTRSTPLKSRHIWSLRSVILRNNKLHVLKVIAGRAGSTLSSETGFHVIYDSFETRGLQSYEECRPRGDRENLHNNHDLSSSDSRSDVSNRRAFRVG